MIHFALKANQLVEKSEPVLSMLGMIKGKLFFGIQLLENLNSFWYNLGVVMYFSVVSFVKI